MGWPLSAQHSFYMQRIVRYDSYIYCSVLYLYDSYR